MCCQMLKLKFPLPFPLQPPWLDSQAAAAVAEDGCHDDDNDAGDIDHMPADDDDDVAPYDGIFTQVSTFLQAFNFLCLSK